MCKSKYVNSKYITEPRKIDTILLMASWYYIFIYIIFPLYFVSLPYHLIPGTICSRTPEQNRNQKCNQFDKVNVGLGFVTVSQYEAIQIKTHCSNQIIRG